MHGNNRFTTLHTSVLALGIGLGSLLSTPAMACDDEPYLGMICTTAATFCPDGYMEAAGQLLAISQYSALYSLMGTTFGGDGRNTFALPDLRGRNAIGWGTGPGLTPINFGQPGGKETTQLGTNELPTHTHTAATSVTLHAQDIAANSAEPAGHVLADPKEGLPGDRDIYSDGTPDVTMNSTAATAQTQLANTGNGAPFGLRSPYLGMRFCVAVQGIFPPRP